MAFECAAVVDGSKGPQKPSFLASKPSPGRQGTDGEETGERARRQKDVRPAGDPTAASADETAAGNDAMQVRMMGQRLPQSVEDGEEAELGQMLGIGGDRLQRFGGGMDRMP